MHVVWVADAPGLVLGRIVCQLVNEAAFALGEGVGSAADIDTGMVHGLNYPRGPLGWADEIGVDHVLALLDGLYDERREERYRAAPALRRLSWSGRHGRETGEGFFSYEARHEPRPMRAVTYQAPGEVRVEDRPEPELQARDDAIVGSRRAGSAARTCTSTTAA